jgi:uncharacterized membrane protein
VRQLSHGITLKAPLPVWFTLKNGYSMLILILSWVICSIIFTAFAMKHKDNLISLYDVDTDFLSLYDVCFLTLIGLVMIIICIPFMVLSFITNPAKVIKKIKENSSLK